MAAQRIDDRDSAVTYSQPASGHHWTDQGSSTSYSNTLRLTRTRGATARLTFQGTAVAVYGLISPSGVGESPVSSYSVDNGPTATFSPTMQAETQSQVLFYDSGNLSPGTHTLIITNQKELDFLWIDSFLITPNPDPSPDPAPAPVTVVTTVRSNTPQIAPDTKTIVTTTSAKPSPSTIVRTEVISSNIVSNGITRVFVSTQELTSTENPTPSLTTKTDGGIGSAQVTRNSDVAGKTKSDPPLAAIIGGVLGALLLVALLLLASFFWKRKKARNAAHSLLLAQPATPNFWPSANDSSPHVTPFGLASTTTGSTSYPGMMQVNGAPQAVYHAHNRSLGGSSDASSTPQDPFNPARLVKGQMPHHGAPTLGLSPHSGAPSLATMDASSQNRSLSVSPDTGTRSGSEKSRYMATEGQHEYQPHHEPQISLTGSEALSGAATAGSRDTGYGDAAYGGFSMPYESPPAYRPA